MKERIMLVEDELITALDIQRMLERVGYQVSATPSSGEEAVEKVKSIMPDLIIMDIFLSDDMDGIEATRRITADMPNVRVIGLSMYEDTEMSERMREAGAVDYVPKGGDPAELVAAVRHAATS